MSGDFYIHSKQYAPPPLISQYSQMPPVKPGVDITKWMLVGVFLVIFVQIVFLGGYFVVKEYKATRDSVDKTIAMVKVIEKYGYPVKGYYSILAGPNSLFHGGNILKSPQAIWTTRAQVLGIQTKLETEYKSVFADEKKKMSEELAQDTIVLKKLAKYDFPGKSKLADSITQFTVYLNSENSELVKLESYRKAYAENKQIMEIELKKLKEDRFAVLEKKYSQSVYFNYPSHNALEQFITSYGAKTTVHPKDLTKSGEELIKIDALNTVLASEIEEQKKAVVIQNIANTTKEADSLIAFYSQRNGYTKELEILNLYKNKVANFTMPSLANVASKEVERRSNEELISLLKIPRESKMVVEEKEKQELIAKQKQLQESAGIPIPPLDVPKLIMVDVAKQRLYAYENGISIFNEPVPITSGMSGFDTVRGTFAIYSKYTPFRMRSPFPGIFYDSLVDFAMFYYQGFAIHDASWRSVYGTMDYAAVGSHGCVNTPYNYVKQLYSWAEIGTAVVVK